MQRGQVLRLCKPRQKPRPPDAIALEEALWADHADIIDPGTLFVLLTLSRTVKGKAQNNYIGLAMHTDPIRRACAFVDQIARPVLGETYVAQQVCSALRDGVEPAVLLSIHM